MAKWYGENTSQKLLKKPTSISRSLTAVSVAQIFTRCVLAGDRRIILFVGSVYLPSHSLLSLLGVGHEIVGHAVRVGSKVKGIKVGDRVGVGAQSGACVNQKGDCDMCANGLEQHCPKNVGTFDSKWPDGSKSYGGYADYWRGQGDLVIPIPDGMDSDVAAPMVGPLSIETTWLTKQSYAAELLHSRH